MARRRKVVIGVGALAAAALALWVFSWTPPAWWQPPDAADAAAATLAQEVESALVEQVHKIREDDAPWSIRITDEQVNAWLALRLPKWIAHDGRLEWPEDVGLVQVHAEDGGLRIGVQQRAWPRWRIASVRVQPAIADGGVRAAMDQVAIGRLRMPMGVVERVKLRVREGASQGADDDGELASLIRDIAGRRPVEPKLKLTDGRVVELVGITLDDGSMVLTGRTKPRDSR